MAFTDFEKDFGYLLPFLDKVAAAANALSDSPARAELTQLLADEKRRWARVRELLSGTTSVAQPKTGVGGVESGDTGETKPIRAFTVGSLRARTG